MRIVSMTAHFQEPDCSMSGIFDIKQMRARCITHSSNIHITHKLSTYTKEIWEMRKISWQSNIEMISIGLAKWYWAITGSKY